MTSPYTSFCTSVFWPSFGHPARAPIQSASWPAGLVVGFTGAFVAGAAAGFVTGAGFAEAAGEGAEAGGAGETFSEQPPASRAIAAAPMKTIDVVRIEHSPRKVRSSGSVRKGL
ncbi:hypothetical protein [Actinoplanes siamensis]|uniref:hypothetical protein n=1 Tax=Actinoplanes siamensis TaxID=1223317 RepID=UPI001945B625|nr:hypothetical protein [Actinoplanes siamensis]